MSVATLRQILLITDGCSNHGEDPSMVASLAHEEGITVNVIGILDQGSMSQEGEREVEQIALAGGGISQVVYTKQLAQTVQMVTRQAMTQTLQGVVNKELQGILGEQSEWEDLPPDQRGEVLEVVDDLGESVQLELFILVDTSASMKTKLQSVQEALRDLSISLQSREGGNLFTLSGFPGKRKEIDQLLNWTPKLDSLTNVFRKMTPSGVTPTGPALKAALNQMTKRKQRRQLLSESSGGEDVEEASS
ncbi:VWA domain-containing protein [Salsuginibacillus kocurii]|uniref:VWA domain-containing protein n=1 Tax=Salsuginibacillus kocurii TaxID=427078 RepID=UPI000364FB22|nr:VWA domain-containing protein [Salsuginibacillus kocurii]